MTYQPPVSILSQTRLEQQTLTTVRALGARYTVRAADATVTTEAWADLAAWPTTSGAAVNTGRLVGSSGSAFAVLRPINIPVGGRYIRRVAIKAVTGGSQSFLTVNNNTAIGTLADAAGIGVVTGGFTTFKGGNVTGSVTAVGNTAYTSGNEYLFTMIIDETHVSWAVQAETATIPQYIARIARSQLPSSGSGVLSEVFSGTNNNDPALSSAGKAVSVTEIATPPTAQRTVASKVLFAAGKNTPYTRVDTTSIRHLIALPGDYDPRVPAPVVLYMHGATLHGGYPFDLNAGSETKRNPITTALLAAGYIVVSSDNGTSEAGGHGSGDDWYGHQTGIDDYVAAVKYARDRFNTGATFLWGESMGGAFLQRIIAQRALGGITAAASICPGTDLVPIEQNGTYQAYIRSAWSAADTAAFLVAIAGKNPIDLAGYQLRGVPQKFYVCSDDTVAPPATHVDPLVTKMTPYVPEATVVTTTGGHVAASTFDAASVVAFFEKYRYSTA